MNGNYTKLLPSITAREVVVKYREIKKAEAAVAGAAVAQSILGLVFIYFTAILTQGGMFRKELKGGMWTSVEAAALILALMSLSLSLTSYFYIGGKKAKLLAAIDKANEKDFAEDFLGEDRLQAIRKDLSPPSAISKAIFGVDFLAALLFIFSEVIILVEIFHPYGLKDLHKSWGTPVNAQCLVDLAALTMVIVAATLRVVAIDEKRRKDLNEKGESKGKASGVFAYLAFPLLSLLLCIFSIAGKVVQGMETTSHIEIGKTEHGSFPLGFTIRAVCLALVIALGAFKVCAAVSEHARVASVLNDPVGGKFSRDIRAEGLGQQVALE